MIVVSIDGELVAPEQAAISIFDRGFLFGDGVFEVFRTWDGVATDAPLHLDRLYTAATLLGIRSLERALVEDALRRTLEASGSSAPGEKRIRVVLTRGPGSVLARADALGPGRTIIIVEPLPAQPDQVSLAIVDWPLPRRRGPGLKTLSYLDHLVAHELAAQVGADEAVRLGADGDVVECATSNLFMVVAGNTVVTPPLDGGILPGITRARVIAMAMQMEIELATPVRLEVHERRISIAELHAAEEIFVTSALRGVVPVTRLDGVARLAGPITAQLQAAYLLYSGRSHGS